MIHLMKLSIKVCIVYVPSMAVHLHSFNNVYKRLSVLQAFTVLIDTPQNFSTSYYTKFIPKNVDLRCFEKEGIVRSRQIKHFSSVGRAEFK